MTEKNLLDRLTEQVGGNRELAKNILIDRGHMYPDGTLTDSGKEREGMSYEERALDRHVNRMGGDIDDYEYDPDTNTCRKSKL